MELFLNEFEKLGYKSSFWLNRYLKFIITFKLEHYNSNVSEKHHIIPKFLSNKFSNLKEHTWNQAILSHRAHIIAHYMLAKAIGGKAWIPLQFYNKKYTFNSRIICEIKEHTKDLAGIYTKNKVVVYDISCGVYKQVEREEFLTNENYVGCNKGRKDIGDKISKALNNITENGKTVAQNKGKSRSLNPMYGKSNEKNPFYGKKHSDETKEIMRNKKLGTKMDEDVKERMRINSRKPKKCKDHYSKYI